jgi:hypothetical protein
MATEVDYAFSLVVDALKKRVDNVEETMRVLVAVGYVKPTKNMYSEVTKFTKNPNERIANSAILALGAMVRRYYVDDAKHNLDRPSTCTF